MASRSVDASSVHDFLLEEENKSTAQKKHSEMLNYYSCFVLVSKNKERNIKDIPIEELDEYLSYFIIWVRTKDGKNTSRLRFEVYWQASSDIARRAVMISFKARLQWHLRMGGLCFGFLFWFINIFGSGLHNISLEFHLRFIHLILYFLI